MNMPFPIRLNWIVIRKTKLVYLGFLWKSLLVQTLVYFVQVLVEILCRKMIMLILHHDFLRFCGVPSQVKSADYRLTEGKFVSVMIHMNY